MPIGDVLVGDARGDVEHDDATLAVDIVTISQSTELLLPCGVPDIELDLTEVLCPEVRLSWLSEEGERTYGGETERVNFYT